MYTETIREAGLAQNEARIYEALLKQGESSVGAIATNSGVNRRNVYDSLNRLSEKGLIFEIVGRNESRYQAVPPKKLLEVVEEKKEAIEKILPALEKLYSGTPHQNEVFIYKGIEGWKNYINDILRVGKDIYGIGAKSAWSSLKLKGPMANFEREIKKKGMVFHVLYDPSVRNTPFVGYLGSDYRFLPEKYPTKSTIIAFGDHVGIFTGLKTGDFDENVSFSMIVNRQIADDVRTWFQFMWDMCSPEAVI